MPFLDFLQVEPARVPRYAAFFVLGIPARRGDRLGRLPARTGWTWLWIGLAGVRGGSRRRVLRSRRRERGLAAVVAFDSLLRVALCTGLLVLFRERARWNSRFSRPLTVGFLAVQMRRIL
ncbi:hypothetical protein [Streptomyces sp. NPDC088115]|uniref:hypothetical protein n=1 Tax=Streptomyces sp. NPDC088115 TaxID=3365824 RepID=UPI0037F3DA6F